MTISESHFALLNCITSGALISHFLSYSYLVCSSVLPLNFRYKLFHHLKLQNLKQKGNACLQRIAPQRQSIMIQDAEETKLNRKSRTLFMLTLN